MYDFYLCWEMIEDCKWIFILSWLFEQATHFFVDDSKTLMVFLLIVKIDSCADSSQTIKSYYERSLNVLLHQHIYANTLHLCPNPNMLQLFVY